MYNVVSSIVNELLSTVPRSGNIITLGIRVHMKCDHYILNVVH